jgi:ElaB/YqjD/DUF883 family membrane-anchored ribosome-binding protein
MSQEPSATETPTTTPTEGESTWTSVTRVANYPAVSNLVETAKGYYNAAKEASPTANFVGEKLEASVQGSYNWIAPKVEPVLHNETVQKVAKTVDETLNKGLDTLESKVEQLKEVKTNLEGKVETIKATTYTVIEGADSYLKDSVVGKPITAALNATEKYLPEEPQQEQGDAKPNEQGPILQAARISWKIQQQALAKLKDLSLRSPDKISAMQYTVDLIQYAATSLDNGVHAVGGKIQKGVENVTEGAKYMYEAPKQLSKDASEKLVKTAHEAADALNTAITTLSQHVPKPVTERVHQTLDVLKHTKETIQLKAEGVDLTLFYNIANKGSETLHEVTKILSEYVAKGEEVPAQVLNAATTRVYDTLDSIVAYLDKHTTTREETGEPTGQTQ